MGRVPSDAQPSRHTQSQVPVDPSPAGIGPGTVLDDRYRLVHLLGQGGTATVYRATDVLLGRSVAVKVFHPHLSDPTMLARQRQEMRVVAEVHHPHLVTIHDARVGSTGRSTDPDGSGPVQPSYLVMEFVDGPTLAQRLADAPLSLDEVTGIGLAIAGALEVLHDRDLVHRDIKPGNILLTSTGAAKLSDFGIARVLDAERVTNSADVIGTAPYLSPEQARGGGVGPPTDVYALGLVLLECLTGHREFPGTAVEAALARLLRDPVVPDTLPAPWPELLRSMTSPRPGDRPTARDVVAALTASHHEPVDRPGYRNPGPVPVPVPGAPAAIGDRGTVPAATTRVLPARRAPTRRARVVLAAAALAAAVIATAAALTLGRADPAPSPGGPADPGGPGSSAASSAAHGTGGQPASGVTAGSPTAPLRITAGVPSTVSAPDPPTATDPTAKDKNPQATGNNGQNRKTDRKTTDE